MSVTKVATLRVVGLSFNITIEHNLSKFIHLATIILSIASRNYSESTANVAHLQLEHIQ